MASVITADQKELERLRKENEELRKAQQAGNVLTPKVSKKGAVSVYGMGRWPVTLYKEQWNRLLAEDFVAELKAFIKANDKQLKAKE